MRIDDITLSAFRNVEEANISFSPKSNVLVGKNAQGKTNLMEAIYLLACGKSFRVSRFREMIALGKDSACVKAIVSGEGLPFELKIHLHRENGKEIYKNGVKLEKISQFLGLFRVVLFCPEHLSLIKDGPGKRRSFLDGAICQLRPYYASLLNECNKLEAQRSALLKQIAKGKGGKELLSVWDERLAQVSVKIACIRADYISHLKEKAPVHFSAITSGKEVLSLSYQSDVYQQGSQEEMEKQYLSLLEKNRETDLRLGFSSKGIHRDDFVILIDQLSAKTYASQGQQRSAVLALKLAEGEISKEMTGKDPVYLLDDVLSELDEERRAYITGGLAGKQVILSGTDVEDFSFVDKHIRVENGGFRYEA